MKLPAILEVRPLKAPPRAVVQVPGSKSVTNRALLVAALAQGRSVLRGALWADDTAAMVECLKRLGFGVRVTPSDRSAASCTIEVEGCGGEIPAGRAELFVDNAGTAARFLAALVASGHGQFRLDGTPRMRERPMVPLLDALRLLGAEIRCERTEGHLPVLIRARGLSGTSATINATQSSQFASALLMIAPLVGSKEQRAKRKNNCFTLRMVGKPVSEPYLEMTAGVMRKFGVIASPLRSGRRGWRVKQGQHYQAQDFAVPPDASAASYFEAAVALCGGCVQVLGLSRNFSDCLQGDVAFADYLERLGCRVSERNGLRVEGPMRADKCFRRPLDMANISDVAITLAVVAPFLLRPTTIRGLRHARLQETDRVKAVSSELSKLGVRVEQLNDGWEIHPARSFRPAVIETYDDHRIAMAFAVLGLKDVMGNGRPWIRIRSPGCVSKTFPNFFEELEALRR